MSDLIKRKEAINELCEMVKDCFDADAELIDAIKTTINELPSAEDVSREDYHNLLTALDDVDRALRQYQAKYENQSTDDNWLEKAFQEKLGKFKSSLAQARARRSTANPAFFTKRLALSFASFIFCGFHAIGRSLSISVTSILSIPIKLVMIC